MITIKEKQVAGGRVRIISKQVGDNYAEFGYLLNGVQAEEISMLDEQAEKIVDDNLKKKMENNI